MLAHLYALGVCMSLALVRRMRQTLVPCSLKAGRLSWPDESLLAARQEAERVTSNSLMRARSLALPPARARALQFRKGQKA